MERRKIFIGIVFIYSVVTGFSQNARAQVSFSGDLTAVSTYVWRGLKANNGPALQSTAAFNYGIVSVGFWGSSIDFGDDLEVETDVFAEAILPTGDLSSAIGITAYMLDFNSFNQYADAEMEMYASLGYGSFSLGVYYVPKQNSTKGDPSRSNYWLELSGETAILGANLSALLSYGTYSSRWMPDKATKDPVSFLTLTAGKSLSEQVNVFWSYTINLDSGFDNILYFGASHVL